MTEGTAKFFLLQVNDALFPIGAYSHSQGLETYIQNGIVHDEKTAEEYIKNKIKWNFATTELLSVKLAYESAEAERLEELEESDMTDEEIRAKDAIVNGDSSVEYSA